MKREFAIRFDPPNKRGSVPAEAFSEALYLIVEGMSAMRAGVGRTLAAHCDIPLRTVLEYLKFNIIPSVHGSNLVPTEMSVVERVPSLQGMPSNPDHMHAVGWRLSSASLIRASMGFDNDIVTQNVASLFVKAADITRKANTTIELAERMTNGTDRPWRPFLRLSGLRDGLNKYQEHRAMSNHRESHVIGEIVTVSYDPFYFTLKPDTQGRIKFSYLASLREEVRVLGGKRAIVGFRGNVSLDGAISEATATDLTPINSTSDPVGDYKKTLGTIKQWSSPEALNYIRSLRGEEGDQ